MFVYLYVHIYVCIFICACVCFYIYMCMCVSACMWKSEWSLISGMVFQGLFTLIWRQDPILTWECPVRLYCWPASPRDPLVSAPFWAAATSMCPVSCAFWSLDSGFHAWVSSTYWSGLLVLTPSDHCFFTVKDKMLSDLGRTQHLSSQVLLPGIKTMHIKAAVICYCPTVQM